MKILLESILKMFSGIVTYLVSPIEIAKTKQSLTLTLPVPDKWKLKLGESINIDGICSTVKEIGGRRFSVYYMPETIRKTNLFNLENGHKFNLERSLTLQSLVGGHLVSGHIDITGEVMNLTKEDQAAVLKFKIDPRWTKFLVKKGSVAVNGVSLTVVEEGKNYFTVSLIPFTLEHTNLGSLKVGQKVNIELDMIAKLIINKAVQYLKK